MKSKKAEDYIEERSFTVPNLRQVGDLWMQQVAMDGSYSEIGAIRFTERFLRAVEEDFRRSGRCNEQ